MNRRSVGTLLLPCLSLIFFYSSCNAPQSVKFHQYYAEGETLYTKYCSNCHQKSGKGLGLLYPPLNPSDYMDTNFNSILCQMKFGNRGEMKVNGEEFNKPMPGISSLTELEIAEIATYIYNTWGHERNLVEVTAVKQALEECAPD